MNKKNFEKNMQNKSKLYNTNRSYTIQLKLYNMNKNCANAKLHFTKIKEIAIKKKSIQYNEKGNDEMSHSDSIPKLIKL